MAFSAVTILMDTLHRHFLQPTPLFPLRNKTKVKSLYKNLSSLQTSIEQDFKVGENDEAIKVLEAQMRDGLVELRFQLEEQLTLFRQGKAMKLRLESAQKLLPILNGAIKDIETTDFRSMLDKLFKHLMLPASRIPAHIKKRVKFFVKQLYSLFGRSYDEQESSEEQENNDEHETGDEQETNDKQDNNDEPESSDEQEISNEQETGDEQENDDKQENNDKQESRDKQEITNEQENSDEQKNDDEQESDDELETGDEQETSDEDESGDEPETSDEQESEDERGTIKERRNILCEAESIIRQELSASYLKKYMKQRIQARQRIRQIFMQGIKLTSYIKKELLKVKNAYHQPKNSQKDNTASLIGLEHNNIAVGDSLQHTSQSTINMVGCNDEFNAIMEKLNQQSSQREIVSIVGMGGIGKTTLARRIYGDASFISCFDCRAWVTISQEYNPIKVFQGLLCSLGRPGVSENNEASSCELAEQVYKRLKHQRYLIVVDDIWSKDVWVDLVRCFQDDNNGSRILLTTRQKNVAEYAGSGTNFCHAMRFLDSNESWNLFQSKVCKRMTVFPEFEKMAREIVEKCKGLPLAITVAAGLLSNSKQDLNEWERIAKNIHTSSLGHSNQQYENIVDLSYTFLPHHLKHCFLSFGCFPEDSELPECFIVDFWVSEGFLKVLRSKSLEDVARESLQDLVDRNLLIFRETNGGLSKEYQMHDVLRELALREAQKENLLCFSNDFGVSFGFRRIQPINSSHTSQPWNIQSKIYSYNSLSRTCNKLLRCDFFDRCRYTKELHFHCKFLRGLMLGNADHTSIETFTEIMSLVHLRWLILTASNCRFQLHYLPLFMLWNLQTLVVEDGPMDESSYEVEVMDESLFICGLPQLRNLYIRSAITIVPPRSVHHNLESIRYLDYKSCTKELFMRIPNLRRLVVFTRHTINPKCAASNWFESLAHLYKLEELEVLGILLRPKFRTIRSIGTLRVNKILPNLKKLKLRFTSLKWKDMDVVGMLSKLEVLILEDGAAAGRKWKPKDGGFHGLKFLSIENCDLQCWKVTSGHFPVLEFLVLICMGLKKIPNGFADITTLKSIKLYECLKSTISSAKRIQEVQREYRNDTFVVDILRADDFRDSFSY